MKITKEHYNFMKQEIAKIWSKEKHDCHVKFVANEGKAKVTSKRVRWDWSYYANLTAFICDSIYTYANDQHLDTALKSIISELEEQHA